MITFPTGDWAVDRLVNSSAKACQPDSGGVIKIPFCADRIGLIILIEGETSTLEIWFQTFENTLTDSTDLAFSRGL